jgi:hypothetical protein
MHQGRWNMNKKKMGLGEFLPRPCCLLLMLILAFPTQAQVAPEATRQGEAAALDFTRRVPNGSVLATLPRLSSPADAPLLNRLWNTDAILAGRPQTEAGMPELMRWAEGASRVLRAYLGLIQQGAADQAEADRRLGTYQDEVTRGFAFLLRISTNAEQGALDRVTRLPAEQREAGKQKLDQDIQTVGLGLAQLSQAVLGLLRNPALRPANTRALASALAEDLPLFRAVLTTERRRALGAATTATLAAQRDAATRAALTSVRQALGRTE